LSKKRFFFFAGQLAKGKKGKVFLLPEAKKTKRNKKVFQLLQITWSKPHNVFVQLKKTICFLRPFF